MTDPLLSIEDGSFWTDPWAQQNARVTEVVLDGKPTLEAAVPGVVDVRRRESLPLVVLYVAPRKETYDFRFENIALVCATRLDDGVTLVGRPFEWAKFTPLLEDPPPGFVGTKHTVDLRRALDVPWTPATYVVWLLFRDRQTAPVRVRLERPASFDDPEVKKFLESVEPPEPAPPRPAPGDPLPTFQRIATSPPLPVSRGIAIAVERLVVVKKGAVATVRGCFRLPVTKAHVVRHGAVGPGPHVTAIVPVTVVVSGSEEVGPLVIPLRVPSYDAAPPGALVTGHFAFDLLSLPEQLGPGQTLFVRAFAGGELAGPELMGLVAETDLPGRSF